jgi:Pyruvate/2-oxoacid:ferredoxin oxidoreductase delta subunit
MKIKIIGKDSPIQKHLKNNVEEILHELGLTCQLDIIHEIDEILKIEEKQILLTPALLIDEKIICQGHIWSKEHIKEFIMHACPEVKNEKGNNEKDKFAKWKGVPRENITWHPIINTDKCTGCGMCVTTCGRNVFDFDVNQNVAVVARPLQCMVGCT